MLEKIAFQKKLISKQDVLKAMAACKKAENYELALKEYFITNNLISEKTITQLINTSDAIKIMKSTLRFGTVAVKMGFITQKILEAALAVQKKSLSNNQRPKLIGQILVDAGKLTKEQISLVVNEQKRLIEINAASGPPQASPEEKPASPAESQPPAAQPLPEPEVDNSNIDCSLKIKQSERIEGGMLLEIEDDGMSAYLKKTDSFDSNLIVEDIYSILSAKGIQYGFSSESAIQGFINSSGFKKNRFEVATGIPADVGKEGRVEYYFDTDHLRAGDMDQEGNIDFKDRGAIPKVEANTLLAEKFESRQSRPGRDIFGRELIVEPIQDTFIKAETGVILSEDGRYAYAEISGHPTLSASGIISVRDVFRTKGDVGYKTGHVIYEGNIEVQGALKSGFRITGHNITIKEIDGGEIFAHGDITILEGVNGAKIFSKGHVSANFIHSSEISCLGNISVTKEIVDSTIESSGACLIKTGKLINTTVSANQGVVANHIGTDKTDPSTITVGKNMFVKKELTRIEKQVIDAEKQKIKLEKRKENLMFENGGHRHSANRLANELYKIIYETWVIETQLQNLDAEGDNPKEIASFNTDLKQKQSQFSQLDRQLNELFDNIEKNESAIEKINESLDTLDDLIDDLNDERENYIDWQETNPGTPTVSVDGQLVEGTIIQGNHAQREIKETVSRVLIKEGRLSTEDKNINLFEIQIHDNFKNA